MARYIREGQGLCSVQVTGLMKNEDLETTQDSIFK